MASLAPKPSCLDERVGDGRDSGRWIRVCPAPTQWLLGYLFFSEQFFIEGSWWTKMHQESEMLTHLRTCWLDCLNSFWLVTFLKGDWVECSQVSGSFSDEGQGACADNPRESRFSLLGTTMGPELQWELNWMLLTPELPLILSAGLNFWCKCVYLVINTLGLPQLLRVHWAIAMRFLEAPLKLMFHHVFMKNVKMYCLPLTIENTFTRRIIAGPCFPPPISFRNSLQCLFSSPIPKFLGIITQNRVDNTYHALWKI